MSPQVSLDVRSECFKVGEPPGRHAFRPVSGFPASHVLEPVPQVPSPGFGSGKHLNLLVPEEPHQFCTLTMCRSMSITVPLAFACGNSTQSPMRMMSLEVIWMLAANESSVFRNTSIRTAASAPTPERKTTGERPRRMATITTPAIT